MSHQEFDLFVRDLAAKFDYAFVTLIFGSLALSFQFSPGMGTKCPWLLIASWLFLLLAGLIGGWRLSRMPVFYRINLAKVKLEDFIQQRRMDLSNPQFLNALSQRIVTDSGSMQPLSKSELESSLNDEVKKKELAATNMKKLESSFPQLFRLQALCFLGGTIFNGLFVSINYIAKASL